MKWYKVEFNDVFMNGLTTLQVGCVVKYKCLLQQLDVEELNEQQLKINFSWKERQFLFKHFPTLGQSKDNSKTTSGQSEDKVGNFSDNKNKDLAIYNNIYNTTNKKEKTDKTEEREEKEINSSEKKYAFEGKIIRLTQKDFDNWQKAYPDLNLYGECLQRDAWLASQPADKVKDWFISTSQYFVKQNEVRKRQNADLDKQMSEQQSSSIFDDEPKKEHDWSWV